MKKKTTFSLLVFALFLFVTTTNAHAVLVERVPVTRVQPNGDTVHFFVTGDEFYHRYHDANDYTLVMDNRGYWVYAQPAAQGGIEPSGHVYGKANPATMGLTPRLTITHEEWLERQKAWELPEDQQAPKAKTSGRNHGDYCNLVVFIRFADDTGFRRSFASVNQMFTDSSSATVSSLYNYFKHVSYNKINMKTYYAPAPNGNTILSYQSDHPRNYYMPYSDDNPIGYTGRNRAEREFDLLVNAVNFINDSFPVPQSYVLDCNGDGFIDNVNFIVIGAQAGWNDLLWPHKWDLTGRQVYINGKQVGTFNFQLEGSGPDYFGVSTFCHEMFHSLGAPDLYRYNDNTNITPVGGWDLMASNSKPPQNMSAYMKYKYGNWLDSIPTLTEDGIYALKPLASGTDKCCYKVLSEDPNQFYVLEYRDNTLTFETGLPGKGIVIWRVDTRFNGNAGYNDDDVFDELWVCRPGSTNRYENGRLNQAAFSQNNRRTEFSPSSDPHPYRSDGTRDLNFSITSIGLALDSIRFHFNTKTIPAELKTTRVTTQTATLSWLANGDAFTVRYRKAGSNNPWQYRTTIHKSATIIGLETNTEYECAVCNLYGSYGNYSDSSQYSSSMRFSTEKCNNPTHTVVGDATDFERNGLPFALNQKYSYSQQIITIAEMDGEQNISTLSMHYAGSRTYTKTNCTIFLGHTDLSHFGYDGVAVPASDLQPVYTGDLTFSTGWNEILLDSLFHYNGVQNMVVAIDDNSEEASTVVNKFYNNSTNLNMTILYGSGSINPDPYDDTVKGSVSRLSRRINMQFAGCPSSSVQAYLCVLSDNESLGTVRGDGYYSIGEPVTIQAYPKSNNKFFYWNDGETDNPRSVMLESDTLFVAFFGSRVGIDEMEETGGYTLVTQGLQLTVFGAQDEQIWIYDLMGRTVATRAGSTPGSTSFLLPNSGVYLVRIGENRPMKVFVNNY